MVSEGFTEMTATIEKTGVPEALPSGSSLGSTPVSQSTDRSAVLSLSDACGSQQLRPRTYVTQMTDRKLKMIKKKRF